MHASIHHSMRSKTASTILAYITEPPISSASIMNRDTLKSGEGMGTSSNDSFSSGISSNTNTARKHRPPIKKFFINLFSVKLCVHT